MLRDDLLNLLNKHRQEAFITCDESCICWELERIIYEFDQPPPSELGSNLEHNHPLSHPLAVRGCPRCSGAHVGVGGNQI